MTATAEKPTISNRLTPSSKDLLKKNSASREIYPYFIEPVGSLPRSQELSTCTSAKPHECSPYTPILPPTKDLYHISKLKSFLSSIQLRTC